MQCLYLSFSLFARKPVYYALSTSRIIELLPKEKLSCSGVFNTDPVEEDTTAKLGRSYYHSCSLWSDRMVANNNDYANKDDVIDNDDIKNHDKDDDEYSVIIHF